MNKKDDDIAETAVECGEHVNEVLVEKKKSNNENDFVFLMNIFDFLTWP